MAVVFSKLLMDEMRQAAGEAVQQTPDVSPILFVFAALAVGAILTLLWKSRVKYFRHNGSAWDPGYPTVEQPPQSVNAQAGRYPVSRSMLAGVAFAMVAFVVAAGIVGQQKVDAQKKAKAACVIYELPSQVRSTSF